MFFQLRRKNVNAFVRTQKRTKTYTVYFHLKALLRDSFPSNNLGLYCKNVTEVPIIHTIIYTVTTFSCNRGVRYIQISTKYIQYIQKPLQNL